MRFGRSRPRFRIQRARLTMTLVLVLFFVSYWKLETGIKPTLEAMTQAQISVIAMDMINMAVSERVLKGVNFRDFVFYEKNQNGDIVFIQSNNILLNLVQTEAVKAISDAIKELSQYEILVPVGQIMGSTAFASVGPMIRIKVLPVGYVDADVYESFESAGINQTKYTVHMKLDATLRAVVPLVRSEVKIRSDIPLATVILPGRVPAAYLQGPLYESGTR